MWIGELLENKFKLYSIKYFNALTEMRKPAAVPFGALPLPMFGIHVQYSNVAMLSTDNGLKNVASKILFKCVPHCFI